MLFRSHVHSEWIEANKDFPNSYTHHYNKQGWIENDDIELNKPPNTYRIFYVGDSFTEGTVPMDESLPSLVEKHLNLEHTSSGINFEVINTGTSSYSPVIYYILIRYYLSKYSPDLIVINVDMSDDFDDWKYANTLVRDAEGNPYAVLPVDIYNRSFIDTQNGMLKAGLLEKIQLFLFENSSIYNLIARKISTNRSDKINIEKMIKDNTLYYRWAWVKHQWDEQTIKNVAFSMSILDRIVQYCDNQNIKVMLTGVPHYPQFIHTDDGQRYWSKRPHQEIQNIAEKNGIAYLDSIEALEEQISNTAQDVYYYKKDMHLNPKGYILWSEAHINFLMDRKNGLLPGAVY